MLYKSISAASGEWFFIENVQEENVLNNNIPRVILRVAAWALTQDDKIFPLVSQMDSSALGLVPSEVVGSCKHLKDFSKEELSHLQSLNHAAVSQVYR